MEMIRRDRLVVLNLEFASTAARFRAASSICRDRLVVLEFGIRNGAPLLYHRAPVEWTRQAKDPRYDLEPWLGEEVVSDD